ncbi:hypothetical protein Lal_00016768 [Lupinus albus]|uniref:Putative mitogen-activated protein kinase kinase kinase STE-STE11 family n=1 Tax=Lupinus albus TaxID=3870 RepID=A0A6A5MHQ5_LUPAL|nr:putative mitogen-activated protein kinase kinase kinase STE-STE11 family [Lupinus albus]KAF1872469.1 hypothetical protein Lal_00016768 [Lupinus albus]
MDWIRGETIGRGSFATVNLAILRNNSTKFSSPTAVKSSEVSTSSLLKNEKQILDYIGSCPRIIRCFGDDYSFENGSEYYNLFLEYASGGSLYDQLKLHGGTFSETVVRRCTRSIIEGLIHIHQNGFVHCDIKLQNILVFNGGDIKIADFGLSKKTGEKQSKTYTGTPMFMSPESVNDNEYESPSDIWALGCAVVEMVTGKPAWSIKNWSNIWLLFARIAVGEELPEIPDSLSEEGKDFLAKCFVKDARKRWTAEMLLKHPFVVDCSVVLECVNEKTSSPRSQFDFPDWNSNTTASVMGSFELREGNELNYDSFCVCNFYSPVDRLREIVTNHGPVNWSDSDGWICVR